MIAASHMQYSLNHMLMANQQNPKTQIRWYNIYRENIYIAWKAKILNPQDYSPTKKARKQNNNKKEVALAIRIFNTVSKKGMNITI